MARSIEPKICPPDCPYLDTGADPWGCENCRLAEDKEDRQLFEEEQKMEVRDEGK